MKLKIYNSDNTNISHKGKKTIRIHKKGGLFSFSKSAQEMIGIIKGSRIDIAQDEESPRDFYIHKTSDPSGFHIHSKFDNLGATFNSAKLADLILDGKPYKSVSFQIGTEQLFDGIPYHLIIVNKPLAIRD